MRLIRDIMLIIPLTLLISCIKPFDPEISEDVAIKYVVSGRVTNTEGWQEVMVSLSSPIENPNYLPVSGCQVVIHDDNGNLYPLEEAEAGTYRAWMDKAFLNPGTSYKVEVHTPDGSLLQSTYDKMMECPPLDSVYYIVKDLPTNDPAVYRRVLQYYVDLNAQGYESHYFKWEVEETWEYHARHALEYYYDGDFHQVYPPDSSNMTCWVSGLVPQIFTLSTTSLTQNASQEIPLHSIDGKSSRLSVLYSMLVRQISLSEEAYNYWEQLRVNSTQQGGLYEKQPLSIIGNIVNITRPDRPVLGYFYAASESTRRYFYSNVPEITLDFNDYCQEDPLGRLGWREFYPRDYPVYYYFNNQHYLRILADECIECQLQGGTTEKPEFWP